MGLAQGHVTLLRVTPKNAGTHKYTHMYSRHTPRHFDYVYL